MIIIENYLIVLSLNKVTIIQIDADENNVQYITIPKVFKDYNLEWSDTKIKLMKPEDGSNSFFNVISPGQIIKIDLMPNESGKCGGLLELFNVVPFAKTIEVNWE